MTFLMEKKHSDSFETFWSTDQFTDRHIGPSKKEIEVMLKDLGVESLQSLLSAVVPKSIQMKDSLHLGSPLSEVEALEKLKWIAAKNKCFRSFIGMGYSECITPAVIQRNILENPGWYTQYTPYQSEIAQGRLEALLNFQTLIMDLTGLPIANASLLDEATAAAEAMNLCFSLKGRDSSLGFFVSSDCFPQTIAVLKTRAEPLGIKIIIGDHETFDFKTPIFGALLQYPGNSGAVSDYRKFIDRAHQSEVRVTIAADLLSLALLIPPGEMGADIAVGSTQRFGIPLGYGGPHAAYFATREELKRQIPGRIVGTSQDVDGNPAIRLALQTREQHIRRDKATSNICTSQVLLAIMASMYAVYHGPDGIRRIAERVHILTGILRKGLEELGCKFSNDLYFDTLKVEVLPSEVQKILSAAESRQINLRKMGPQSIGISLDEATTEEDLETLLQIFSLNLGSSGGTGKKLHSGLVGSFSSQTEVSAIKRSPLARKSPYLEHPVFNQYHSETEMLRYLFRLQSKDLSLAHSMIPLGSCTMKLNATAEMLPVTWPEWSRIHPFAPLNQAQGYQELFEDLEKMLAEITGFSAVSLQPNAGSQGEYAGLWAIRRFHESRGESHRKICLIPKSAHGTNPATASMVGMQVVVVDCDEQGNVDLQDLRKKTAEHRNNLAALMVTYPSTHGVFEEQIQEICSVIHQAGGQVYMDGANMNAQIGLCKPAEIGADVCHLNLHKTFCIPHGGGGPGAGPIGVASHLAAYLPSHPVIDPRSSVRSSSKLANKGVLSVGPVAAAPWGSASIMVIPWMYIQMMGGTGLKQATAVAILNANYIARKLSDYYPVLYKGQSGYIAHECVFDLRSLKGSSGVEVEDVAKRLIDYGFHAPTISFPVAGTLMVEPTESESKAELDRFCDAMISIRREIAEIESGKADRQDNLLKNAPHTAEQIAKDEWTHPYSRERAVFPRAWVKERKFWPAVGRINNVLGDRNLVCGCSSATSYR